MRSYAGGVRKFLRPGWLVLHVLVLLAMAVMVGLGVWQWRRGGQMSSLRSFTYSIEWYVFAGLTLLGYLKVCRDSLVPDPDEGVLLGSVEGVQMSSATGLAAADQWNDDPEVAEWNQRFAQLHAQHALKESRHAEKAVRGSVKKEIV